MLIRHLSITNAVYRPLYDAGVNFLIGSGTRVNPSRRRTPSILADPSPATRVRGPGEAVDFSVHRR